jgi:pimeloyl-ACP methyl ester carboxylesterase
VRGKLVLLLSALVALAATLPAGAGAAPPKRQAKPGAKPRVAKVAPKRLVKIWRISYRAHDGHARRAFVALPAWYGKHNHPRIPLIISPHGRGVSARANARLWGALPARGSFGVISPEGAGRKLPRYSWGSFGQIRDLARMPEIAWRALPWLRIDQRRVYAVGGSMGGQETLLLLARYPKRLAGAAAFDAVADFARQYHSFPFLPCTAKCRRTWNGHIGKSLQSLAQQELGGTPRSNPAAYAVRSPVTYARSLAFSCVPLQLWWSVSDKIVINSPRQSGSLFKRIKGLNPKAPVQAYVGYWSHSAEMHAKARLPAALAQFGLLDEQPRRLTAGLHIRAAPAPERRCAPAKRPRPARVAQAPIK